MLISDSASVTGATLALRSSPLPVIPTFGDSWKVFRYSNAASGVLRGRGRLLSKLTILNLEQYIVELSFDLCAQTERIENYLDGIVSVANFEKMLYRDMRINIQHRLISLPESNDQPMYEAYRLGLWIYSYAVTYGAPFHLSIRQILTQKLVHALREVEERAQWAWSLLPEALLWIMFFGGITATGLSTRMYFVQMTAKVLKRLELKRWEEVKSVLHSFLWLDLACDSGGKALYLEAFMLSLDISNR